MESIEGLDNQLQSTASSRSSPKSASDRGDASSITIGIPYIGRQKAIRRLLESIPDHVERVVIADNSSDGLDVPLSDYRFDVDVLALGYNVGFGRCRAAIVEVTDTPYLFMGDSDMRLSSDRDLTALCSILERDDGLGGVSGVLHEREVLRSGGCDLYEARIPFGRTALVRGTREPPEIREVGPYHVAEFDFIPQAGVFRTEIFDTYTYDPDMVFGEHPDFFWGHKQAGEWRFAVTPSVIVNHDKGRYAEYRRWRRKELDRHGRQARYRTFKEKWGIDVMVTGGSTNWFTTHRTNRERLFDVFRDHTPPYVWVPARQTLNTIV